MTTYKLYQVYCIEEAEFRKVTSFTEPIECPLIHNDRTIDSNQTTIIDEIPIIGNRMEYLVPKLEQVSTKKYFDLKTNFFFDTSFMEIITDFKIISYFENKSGDGSYDFRVYDKTHNLEIGSVNLSNTELETNNIGTVSNLPTENALLEFHIKVANPSDKAYIRVLIVQYKSNK